MRSAILTHPDMDKVRAFLDRREAELRAFGDEAIFLDVSRIFHEAARRPCHATFDRTPGESRGFGVGNGGLGGTVLPSQQFYAGGGEA